MTIILPQPLATDLTAEATTDVEALADCFTADAVVRDEGRTIRGLDAIKAWKKDTKAKYEYTVEPLEVVQDQAAVMMLARLTGKFPGSPIEVTYRFILANDKIALLEIQ
jgi:ketosteroid isomerase-like protein